MWTNLSTLTSLANFMWAIKAESKGSTQNIVSGKSVNDFEVSKYDYFQVISAWAIT